jgi:hypothetical protein
MKCKYYNATIHADAYTHVTWRIFYPQCPKLNVGLCSQTAGAYVAATTVCQQRLF